MGSCVSVHKNPDSALKFRLSIGSKTGKMVIPSAIEENPVNGEHPTTELGFKSQLSSQPPTVTTFRDFGSKEETFFDSQPWLESDCEDDFFSVNDFTPSRGSTPIHQSSFIGTPRLNKFLFVDGAVDSKPEPSPTDKKKKLAELFRESFDNNDVLNNQNIAGNQIMANGKPEPNSTNLVLPPKSTNGTPYMCGANSVCSSERTPNRDPKHEKEKLSRAAQCCLPSLVQNLSFNDKKKKLSPGRSGGG
uniref:Uncharacterized protein n=1 Tax=Nelumbo nucifera TaxID=4432 RepID=A0A822YRT0_NELNU|nr:TPA_asm: hypothetical protein HUJ06_004921 [Nelumbo nucifera]